MAPLNSPPRMEMKPSKNMEEVHMHRSNKNQVRRICASWLKARGWARNEKGSVLPIAALGMTAMLGFMGLALDFGNLYRLKRNMQTAADAGAMAGASELFRSKPSLVSGSSLDGTATNKFTHGSAGVTVDVSPAASGPTTGFFQGDNRFVEVEVSQSSPSFFIQLFGINSTLVRARAVAGAGAKSANCIYALDPSEESFDRHIAVEADSQLWHRRRFQGLQRLQRRVWFKCYSHHDFRYRRIKRLG